MADYSQHLSKDRKLKKLLQHQELVSLESHTNICLRLCSSVMSQQLSVKVARVIYNRFLALFDGSEPTARQIIDTDPVQLRSIGLSNAKVSYVRNIASFELEHGMGKEMLDGMSDEEVVTYLTQIKGVGRWTVEMLQMFTLGRPDIFPADDLGIQNAMIHLYKLSRDDKKKFREDMFRIAAKWRPYRTYACLHLWRWKDSEPS